MCDQSPKTWPIDFTHWRKVYSYITCIWCNRRRKETRRIYRLYFAPLVVVPEVHCLCFQLDFQPATQIKRAIQSSDQSFNTKLQFELKYSSTRLLNSYLKFTKIWYVRSYFAMRVRCKWILFTRSTVTVLELCIRYTKTSYIVYRISYITIHIRWIRKIYDTYTILRRFVVYEYIIGEPTYSMYYVLCMML